MPSAYFALILRGYGVDARTRAALVANTGIVPDAPTATLAEISLGQQLQQIRNANRALEPGWSLVMGSSFHPATHGPIGIATVSAPTVRDAVTVMTRFSQVRSPHFRLRRRTVGREVFLIPEDRVPLAPAERRALLDIVLLSTQQMIESVLGRAMTEARFELADPAPEHAARYPSHFHADVRFARTETAIVLPAAWLDLPCPLADPLLFDAAWQSLAAGERRLHGDYLVPADVEQLVAARGREVGVPAVARALGTSRRTLARRLQHHGTSYRRLLDHAQRQQAETLLRDRHLTIAEIATALGYQDAANFGRACRRWFGTSPGAHRASMQSSLDPS